METKEITPVKENSQQAKVLSALMRGDISKMNEAEQLWYYKEVCDSLGLNYLTRPFELITLSGKLTFYATRACTEQLRRANEISIQITSREKVGDIYIVSARALDRTGRTDESTGVVSLMGLKGDNLANALMKCETKAKRRVTLSICGLGWLDESETETIAGAKKGNMRLESGADIEPEADIAPPPPSKFVERDAQLSQDSVFSNHLQMGPSDTSPSQKQIQFAARLLSEISISEKNHLAAIAALSDGDPRQLTKGNYIRAINKLKEKNYSGLSGMTGNNSEVSEDYENDSVSW